MKRTVALSYMCIAALISLTIAADDVSDLGSEFELNWHTVDGGGGPCSGGVFEMHGTIGQPDAGASTGGDFEIRGGFWAGGVTPAPTCPSDIALPHNGMVDIDDLVLVITNWGTSGGPADINDDNIVNIDDLVAVITNWGACP